MIKSSRAPIPRRLAAGRKYIAKAPKNIAKKISYFMCAAVLSGMFAFGINSGQSRLEDFLYAQISVPLDNVAYATHSVSKKANLDLNAKAALSLRVGATGREKKVYQKNIDDQLPIASLTKLMTAIIVLESPEFYNMDKQVAIDWISASQDDVPVFGNLNPGEIYSVRQLLNLMLYYSSNDAAYALSEIMGKDRFVAAMNQKTIDLKLEKTIFYNPHGLDLDNGKTNLSSAEDLLVLIKYISENHPEIFSFSIKPGPYVTENGIFNPNLWSGQTLIGGKTGYTEKAGGCMVLIFENENHRRYINILLGAVSSETRVVEMQKLINYVNNSDI